jgi:Arc/MetJ family transcription regulator
MAMTSVDVDLDVLAEAAEALGTRTKRDTINAALLQAVQAKRADELIELFRSGVFELDPDEVRRQANREFPLLDEAAGA